MMSFNDPERLAHELKIELRQALRGEPQGEGVGGLQDPRKRVVDHFLELAIASEPS
jgi:hypothetical protein